MIFLWWKGLSFSGPMMKRLAKFDMDGNIILDLCQTVNSCLKQAWCQSSKACNFWSLCSLSTFGVSVSCTRLVFPMFIVCFEKMSV